MTNALADFTPNLSFPFLLPAQAQKHVTVNKSLAGIDSLLLGAVISQQMSAPPAELENGDAFIVSQSADGVWQGREGQLAVWADSAWTFYSPKAGWRFWLNEADEMIVFDGAGWRALNPAVQSLSNLGINTSADATNRLAVKSDAVLISHDDVTPGSGDVRIAINKLSTAETASVVFQTGWSARGEIGLTGLDDLTIRVTPDGETWLDAMQFASDSGNIGVGGLPNTTDRMSVQGLFSVNGADGRVENQPNGRIALHRNSGGPVYVRGHSPGSSLHFGATNEAGTMQGNALVINPDAERLQTSFTITPRNNVIADLGAGGAPFRDLYLTNAPVILSDRRQKHDVETFDAGLEVLQALNPVTYFRKEEPGVRRVGLIAQHVRSALKDTEFENSAIWRLTDSDDPESLQAVSYGELIPILVDAVNELAERVETLEAAG